MIFKTALRNMPNFIIVGAEKSGTSSLYQLLISHPDIFMPETKELSFFNDNDSNGVPISLYAKRGLTWYQSFFLNKKSQQSIWRGEASPLYMESKASIDRIYQFCGDVKIICILRDPIDRYLSCVKMATRNGDIKLNQSNIFSNKKSILFLERGLYGKQIKNIKSKFTNLLVLDFEDLKDAKKLKKKVADFFNLEITKFGELPHSNPMIYLRFSKLYKLKRYIARKLRNNNFGNYFLNFKITKKISRLIDKINTQDSSSNKDFILDKENYIKLKRFYLEDVQILKDEKIDLSFIKNYKIK